MSGKNFQYMRVAFVILLCYVSNGAAIKCYVCDSSINPSCVDPKSNSSLTAEDCTLDKIKSLDTWLFDLNKFSYFDTGGNKNPLMNCQKVVAKDPTTQKMVTARFCQLDTGDSDACTILRAKLKITGDGNYAQQNNRQQSKQQTSAAGKDVEQFHCSTCNTTLCNGSRRSSSLTFYNGILLAACSLLSIALMQSHRGPGC